MPTLAVLSDAPVTGDGDHLDFRRYVDPVVSVLTNPASRTPFTIGILGAWGSGKSSILAMIDEKLQQQAPKTILRVHFNPWVHRHEPNMLPPLLHALRDTLRADPDERFDEAVDKVAFVLSTLAADALLGTLTAGRINLKKFEAAKQRYIEQRNIVESELRTLRQVLRGQLENLEGRGVRVVFFIDDIDRCEPDQVVDLLESVKLFLDVPGVFVVMAISKDLVDRGVAIRYHDYGFEKDSLADLGDEYLEKMIQLPLYLLPLDGRGVRQLLANLADPELLAEHGALLEAILVPNPRKIKRVLNFWAVTKSIVAETEGLDDLNPDLTVRLTVLRVQLPRLFAALLVNPQLLLVLEKLYRDELAFDEGVFREHFGTVKGDALFRTVFPYYHRQPQLAQLFETSAFRDDADRLTDYLTLFGG